MQRVETHTVCDVCGGSPAEHKVRLSMPPKGMVTADLCDAHAAGIVELYGKLRATKHRRGKALSSVRVVTDISEVRGEGKAATPPEKRSTGPRKARTVARG